MVELFILLEGLPALASSFRCTFIQFRINSNFTFSTVVRITLHVKYIGLCVTIQQVFKIRKLTNRYVTFVCANVIRYNQHGHSRSTFLDNMTDQNKSGGIAGFVSCGTH